MSNRSPALNAVTEIKLSYKQRGALRRVTKMWLMTFVEPSDLYLTFAWNKTRGFQNLATNEKAGLSISRALRDLDEFVKHMDKYSVGPRYHKKPAEFRCVLIAAPEHLDSNLHYHGVLQPGRFPDGCDLRDYVAESERVWKHLVKGGSLRIDAAGTGVTLKQIRRGTVPDTASAKRVVNYITKVLAKPGAWDGLFVAGAL